MRRRRWRTLVLWSGCTLCVLIAVAFVVSARWAFILQVDPAAVYVYGGSVVIVLDDPFISTISIDQHVHGLSRWATFTSGHNGTTGVEFPLFVPFLGVALPTFLVWRCVPKFPRGCCQQCGYDLRGNVSGVCSECGASHTMPSRATQGEDDIHEHR